MHRPAKGNVTNGYRAVAVNGKAAHQALDFGYGNGREVYAADAGILTYDESIGYGLRGSIKHPSGTFSRYAHLSRKFAPPGRVDALQQIGVMGDSGTFADGVHLHFEVLEPKGAGLVRVDPNPYLTGTAGDGGIPINPDTPEALQEQDDTMSRIIYINNFQAWFIMERGRLEVTSNPNWINQIQASRGLKGVGDGATAPNIYLVDDSYARAIVQEETSIPATELAKIPVKGPFLWERPVGSTGVGEVDLAPVLAAIATLNAEGDQYQSALLAKLDTVDEATLATFGLKRA